MKKQERDNLNLIGQGFTGQQRKDLFFLRHLWRKRLRRRVGHSRSLTEWTVPKLPDPPKRPRIQRGADGYDSY